MTGERIELHHARHQRVQAIEAPPHVAGRGPQVHAHARRQVHHGRGSRTTLNTVRSAAASHGTRSRSPPTSANSIHIGAGAALGLVSTSAKTPHRGRSPHALAPHIEGVLGDSPLPAERADAPPAALLLVNRPLPSYSARSSTCFMLPACLAALASSVVPSMATGCRKGSGFDPDAFLLIPPALA